MVDFERFKEMISKDYEEYVVAFVDVLGYKSKIEETILDSYDTFNVQDLILVGALMELLKKEYTKYENALDVRIFSDCMYVFAVKDNADILFDFLIDLEWIILDSTPIIVDLTSQKTKKLNLLRGGVAYGKALINDVSFFGPVVNAVYNMESKDAIYPRIIVDNGLIKFLKNNSNNLAVDDDEKIYIDYIKASDNKYPQDRLQSYVQNLDNQISACKDDKIVAKLKWMKKYLLSNMKL